MNAASCSWCSRRHILRLRVMRVMSKRLRAMNEQATELDRTA